MVTKNRKNNNEFPPDTQGVEKDGHKQAKSGSSYDEFCEKVRRVLPDAVAGSLEEDERLADALQPTVEESLRHSVKKDSRALVDAIFPILGPMIRRSIAETMRSMVQSLNRSLEYTFTLRGLKWRWEAFISGKSFAEVVMLHTLAYRVEQVFLIHRESGLPLLHVADESVNSDDNKENMVSAMLTAIQDFVHDSFNTEDDSQLHSIQVGDLNVWLEPADDIVLAAVIRGEIPLELQHRLRNTVARIENMMHDELRDFNGDTAPFQRARFDLENCLEEKVNVQRRIIPLTWIILITPVVIFLIWAGLSTTENWQWKKYLRRIHEQPGLIVIDEGHRDGNLYITGMRDNLAADPLKILAEQPLIASKVKSRWIPYQSLQPAFVLKRAIAILKPPATVELSVNNGTLVAKGDAHHQWIANLKSKAMALPGISNIDTGGLRDLDAPIFEAWNNFVEQLKATPGILVTATHNNGLNFRLEGLRDPLARDPRQIMRQYPELRNRVKFQLDVYSSNAPKIALRHAIAILNPPDSVKITIDEHNRLHIAGHASRDWITRAKIAALAISGISSIDTSDLHNISGNRYSEWQRYLDKLDKATGLTVIEHGERDGKFFLIGFADKLADDPYDILKTTGLSRRDIRAKWLPSPQVSKKFILAHAQKILRPPATVTLQRVGETLIATGAAPHNWIRDARVIARCLPGITAFNDDLLVDRDFENLDRIRYRIDKTTIMCARGSVVPAADQADKTVTVAKGIMRLYTTALNLDSAITVTIIGHAPDTAASQKETLAETRANEFKSILIKTGLPKCVLNTATDNTPAAPDKESTFNKQGGLSFKVNIITPNS